MAHIVKTTVHGIIERPIHEVYEFFIPIDLADILVGWGPLPRVVRTSNQTGPWDTVGSKRTVHLADGSTASEEVTLYTIGEEFGYTVSQFTNPIRLLTRQAKGHWTFSTTSSNDTQISWTYSYEAHNLLSKVLLTPIVKLLWERYMQRALDEFIKLSEQRIDKHESAYVR